MSAHDPSPEPDFLTAAKAPSHPEALRADSVRFRLLVENSRDIILEISSTYQVLYVSPNVTAVLGFTAAELVGTSLLARVHPEDLAKVHLQLDRHGGRATARHIHRDGTWRWFEATGREFVGEDGQTRRVVVARDITAVHAATTDRDRLEGELARAEKLNAMGTLAGGMVHDFNNLLTAILSYATLARPCAQVPDVRHALDQIIRAGDRARCIARQMLECSGQQKQGHGSVNVAHIAREVLQLLRPSIPAGVEVVADLCDHAGTICANASQLHRVLVNLCHNALHALPARNGRLIVQVARVDAAAHFGRDVSGPRRGPHLCVSIIDNGHGMNAETRRRMFEPFFTTKPRGAGCGLGLAVVQQIVRDHGGVIQVRSEPDEGTAFRIFFPLGPSLITHARPESEHRPGLTVATVSVP